MDHPPDLDSTQSMPPPATSVGSVLKDRYLIVRELSHGGFGKVFLAQDQQLHDRPVVIKIKLDHAIEDPWFERKFGEELRALTVIDHPGVVGVLDSGRTADGKPFLVMQYIQGSTLRAVLAPEGLPLDRVASIVRQIGQALGAAHEKKIWHRDLKPENIMLQILPGGDEHVKLIDFGIATIADLAAKQTRTRVAGSLAYMAPEQVSGQPTAATDIYAFGVIAYEMVTGRKPFVPEDALQLSVLQRAGVRVRPSALRPGIPPSAEKLILQSLNYNPNERPISAHAFGDELSQALLADTSATRMDGARPRRGSVWAAIGMLALIAAIGGVWIYRGRIAPAKPETTNQPAAAQKPDPNTDAAMELAFWNSISASSDTRLFRDYLEKYPNGKFASLAKHKLEPQPDRPAAAKQKPEPQPDRPAGPKQKPEPTATATGLPAAIPQERPLTRAPAGFIAIFNGKDLSGWRGRQRDYSPHAEALLSPEDRVTKQAHWNADRDLHWSVDTAKGEIVTDGKSVHLATVRDFSDFELHVDWLLVDHNGDSGIYLRSYPQVQIWDVDNPSFNGVASRGSGALWNNNADNPGKWPLVKADHPVGQWNTFRIKMIGSRVWVWLNGQQTVNGQVLDNSFNGNLPLVPKGPIELQSYSGEIRFRNIYVREIPAAEVKATLDKLGG
ncbi:MAG: DUF1080 domain-containing protein [Acidobacteriia bacterium]|nr:DUF1080 domain-containing protein [Terriglobia bacterium]